MYINSDSLLFLYIYCGAGLLWGLGISIYEAGKSSMKDDELDSIRKFAMFIGMVIIRTIFWPIEVFWKLLDAMELY